MAEPLYLTIDRLSAELTALRDRFGAGEDVHDALAAWIDRLPDAEPPAPAESEVIARKATLLRDELSVGHLTACHPDLVELIALADALAPRLLIDDTARWLRRALQTHEEDFIALGDRRDALQGRIDRLVGTEQALTVFAELMDQLHPAPSREESS